jgi:hypothetical protein
MGYPMTYAGGPQQPSYTPAAQAAYAPDTQATSMSTSLYPQVPVDAPAADVVEKAEKGGKRRWWQMK